MANLDRLERLTDLVLVLLHTRTPRTLDDIAASVPGYPPAHAARRQAFERDKRILRDEGIPVLTEPVEGPEQFGYRIDPDAFYLRDLELEPDEQAALLLAVAGVHLGDPSGRDALSKLGASGVAETRPVAQVDAPRALVPLFDAVRSQSEVRFAYHGTARAVAPSSLQFRGGRWYLVGWDRERAGARTFRIDRIEALGDAGPPGSGALPPEFSVEEATVEPWRAADEDTDHVLVRVDAVEGPRVAAEVGERALVERGDDGSVLLRLGVSSFEVLRSWVLGLLDHAEVVGPPPARAAVVAWLDAMRAPDGGAGTGAGPGAGVGVVGGAVPNADGGAEVGAVGGVGAGAGRGREPVSPTGGSGGGDAKSAAPPPPPPVLPGTGDPAMPGTSVSGSPARRAPGRANARLRRLLAIVAWLAEVQEASIAEVSARFDISQEEVVGELELAACCGIPPYSPDTLLEIVVSDDTVQAFLPKELARPRRLTPAEGLALAASARTILAVPGADRDGALGRAFAKLESVLGDYHRLVIQLDAPSLLDEVKSLVTAGVQAEIVYHSASSDETTERVVDPLDVISLDGHWYLDAYCHRSGGVRRFRVDRIRELRPLGTPVSAEHASRPGGQAFVPGPGAVQVTIELGVEARWVADSVPVLAERELPGDVIEVTLAVGGTAWLERLLLQAGPHARVVSPARLAGVGAEAAARLLAHYR